MEGIIQQDGGNESCPSTTSQLPTINPTSAVSGNNRLSVVGYLAKIKQRPGDLQ
jgi:hypothetical protein